MGGGFVEVVTGGASVGQGFETAMAQICAETLGVDYRRIRVVHGQTDRIRFGIGAHASRATVMTGGAVHVAASEVRQKALAQASILLQAPAEQLDIVDGMVMRRDAPTRAVHQPRSVVASMRARPGKRRRAVRPGLYSEGWFHTDHMAFPYGIHCAIVRVDRGTGQVAVERYFVANDVGRAVNPMLIDGQITGGVAQGLGGALYEEFRYSETGQPLSATLADYLVPTILEMPHVEVMITEDAPSPNNPLGVKGVGEGGCTGVGAAIASAIDAALGRPGARHGASGHAATVDGAAGAIHRRRLPLEAIIPRDRCAGLRPFGIEATGTRRVSDRISCAGYDRRASRFPVLEPTRLYAPCLAKPHRQPALPGRFGRELWPLHARCISSPI